MVTRRSSSGNHRDDGDDDDDRDDKDDSGGNSDDADDVCTGDDDVDGRFQWKERQPAHRPPLLRALRSHHRQVGQLLLLDAALFLGLAL